MTEKAAVDAAMDAIDKLTDEWWSQCRMDEAVANIASMIPGELKERTYNLIAGLIKVSYGEGVYRGFMAGKEFNGKAMEEQG